MPKTHSSRLTALIWAFFFTGFGQIYLGRVKRGLCFALIHFSIAAALLTYIFYPTSRIYPAILVPTALFVLFEIYVIAEAYLYSCKLNATGTKNPERFTAYTAGKVFLLLIVIFILNGHVLMSALISSYVVPVPPEPSISMEPTIKKGDVFLINKVIYRKATPSKGDVIVFNYPHDQDKAFVKRVRDVKEGRESFYVVGDNKDHSVDSRHWGLVKREHLIGKAYKIIYPFKRSGGIK